MLNNIKVFILASTVLYSGSIFAAQNNAMSPQTNMSSEMHSMQKKMDDMMMKDLGGKDAMYDMRFIDLMIPHHEAAIMMAKDAIKNAEHPELKKMAQDIITAQEDEIKQLKEWRKKWYGNSSMNH